MKIIAPSVEIMRTGLETELILPEQFIEKVGRTCYKSEDKITEDSAGKFVGNLINRGHEAMIEHWNLIFRVSERTYDIIVNDWIELLHATYITVDERVRPYLRFTHDCDDRYIISGNMRTWRDFIKAFATAHSYIPKYVHGLIRNYPLFFPEFQNRVPGAITNDILKPISVSELTDSERRVHQNVTVKIVCDRGVSHEIVRHRVASFAQESTRYCNYGLDKFGKEITVIRPSWCDETSWEYSYWKEGCQHSEDSYFELLDKCGATPQQARSVLVNSLKTEIIVTMNLDGWDHFFELRCAPSAHPDMQEVAKMSKSLFGYHGLI